MHYVLDVPTNKIYLKNSTNCSELIFFKSHLLYRKFGTKKENVIENIEYSRIFFESLRHIVFFAVFIRYATEEGM